MTKEKPKRLFVLGTKCPCLECDPTGENFKRYFGRYPWDEKKTRKTPEQATIAKRERAELMEKKRAGRARYQASRKKRK